MNTAAPDSALTRHCLSRPITLSVWLESAVTGTFPVTTVAELNLRGIPLEQARRVRIGPSGRVFKKNPRA